MKIRTSYIFTIIILILNFNIALADKYDSKKEDKNDNKPNSFYYKQFQDVFERIEKDYIKKLDKQEMTDEAINAMLRSLDPYSSYHTGEDLEFFLNQTEGEFGGIGVEIMYDNGAVKVISPIDDLPAYKAGIRAGDYIIGVNGDLVSNMGFNKAVKEMRGEPGTALNLLILKEDETKPQEVELKREIVKIKPIKYELEKDSLGYIAYLRIVTFNNNTIGDLKKAMSEMEKKAKQDNNSKINGIILDVRNNPGGLLSQAVAVSEYFIPHGMIVSTKSNRKSKDISFSSGRFATKAPNVPVVVLINSGSASASEIVAGAMQDHDRAVIMGTTSFGKGLVQTFTQINDRAAMKLTTAKYYTPNHRSINAKGIEPDIFIEMPEKVEYKKKEEEKSVFSKSSVKSYLQKYNKDETNQKPVKQKKNKTHEKVKPISALEDDMSKKYKEDYQYARAYDLIRGLIITKNPLKSEQKTHE